MKKFNAVENDMMELALSAKLYNSGKLDRTPFKVRREAERVIDEMINSVSDAEYVAARLERANDLVLEINDI